MKNKEIFTVSSAGKKGGSTTLKRHGVKHFKKIAQLSAKNRKNNDKL